MKETMSKMKERFHANLDREPTESERLRNIDNHKHTSTIAIGAFVTILLAIMFMLSQPVSFTGEIVVSGGVGGSVLSNTTLSNYSESLDAMGTQTDINVTLDNMDGEIKISGSYEMPMYAYYKFLTYLEEG